MRKLSNLVNAVEIFTKLAQRYSLDPESILKRYDDFVAKAKFIQKTLADNTGKTDLFKTWAPVKAYELNKLINLPVDIQSAEKILEYVKGVKADLRQYGMNDIVVVIDPYIRVMEKEYALIEAAAKEIPPPAEELESVPVESLPNAPKQTAAKIDPYLQKKLNDSGYTPALKVDGVLGPATKKAIDWFRGEFNVPGNFDLNDVLEVIKQHQV